jgi:hypothetical protein
MLFMGAPCCGTLARSPTLDQVRCDPTTRLNILNVFQTDALARAASDFATIARISTVAAATS